MVQEKLDFSTFSEFWHCIKLKYVKLGNKDNLWNPCDHWPDPHSKPTKPISPQNVISQSCKYRWPGETHSRSIHLTKSWKLKAIVMYFETHVKVILDPLELFRRVNGGCSDLSKHFYITVTIFISLSQFSYLCHNFHISVKIFLSLLQFLYLCHNFLKQLVVVLWYFYIFICSWVEERKAWV